MVKILMHGCNGAMGQVITNIVREDENSEIVAGIDVFNDRENGYPVYKNINSCDIRADVIIDFSTATAVDAVVDYAVDKKIPLVL